MADVKQALQSSAIAPGNKVTPCAPLTPALSSAKEQKTTVTASPHNQYAHPCLQVLSCDVQPYRVVRLPAKVEHEGTETRLHNMGQKRRAREFRGETEKEASEGKHGEQR